MLITVNGAPLALEVKEGGSLGELLAEADALLDKAGNVIVSLRVDDEEVEAEFYSRFAERRTASVSTVEIKAEKTAAIKLRAIETLLELLGLAKQYSEDTAAEAPRESATAAEAPREARVAADWPALRTGAHDLRDAFAGLFPADELSFVRLFAELLDRAGDEPDKADRVELSAQADRLGSFFGERLAELVSPEAEMRKAAALFDEKSPELAELPVLLQTGKEDRAMKAVVYFIEIFNKVIRVIPELRRGGLDTEAITVGGSAMSEFFSKINDVLRELTGAFEHNDAVLIGDLAEYEILPKMRDFFAAMRAALPES